MLADEASSIAAAHEEPLMASLAHMWPPIPTTSPSSSPAAGLPERSSKQQLYIRDFQASDQEVATSIFYEGIKERIPSSAFTGLKYQPVLQCVYAVLTSKYAKDGHDKPLIHCTAVQT